MGVGARGGGGVLMAGAAWRRAVHGRGLAGDQRSAEGEQKSVNFCRAADAKQNGSLVLSII